MTYCLRDFGSYTVGGRTLHVTEGAPREVHFTRTATYTYDPRGHFDVEQTYVQYFVPDKRRDVPPILLIHGGGMHGSVWDATPDGRPGWLHLLLDQGFEVHVVDMVERGRSGFAPGQWDDDPILRSHEESWVLFRFGAIEGLETRDAFAGQQFPVEAFDVFQQRIVPRWLSTTPIQSKGIVDVLDHLGQATVICHSQGGEIIFDAVAERPDAVCGILAVEPSAFPQQNLNCPVVFMAGDYLETAQHWIDRSSRWRKSTEELSARGVCAQYVDTVTEIAPGGSHFLMMDRHSADVLALGLDRLRV